MKKIVFLIISFCWLVIKPISSQTNWADYKDVALKLVKYGIYSDGKEVNVFTPPSADPNKMEYIQLKSDGTFIWGNSGNGTEYLKYSINGDLCNFNRSSTGQRWIRLVKKTGNMLFTVDNLNTYRYFQTGPTNNTSENNEQSSGKDVFTGMELEEIFNYNPYNHLIMESSFHEGLAKFSLYGCYGFVNKQGQVIIPAKYSILHDFQDGLVHAWDRIERKGMYIDQTGKKVIETSTILVGEFHEGLACIYSKQEDLWGYINKQGKIVIPFRYDLSQIYDKCYFLDGFALVRRNNLWGIINEQGQEVVPLKYNSASLFSEGLARVEKDGKCGFVDKTGREVIPLEYDNVHLFSEGLANVKKDGKMGLIDKTGREVIPLEYDDVQSFSEGYAAVEKNHDNGFINKSGRVVIPLKYYSAGSFSEGFARVNMSDIKETKIMEKEDGEKIWCYTSRKTGKIVETEYSGLGGVDALMSLLIEKSDYRFIDKNGKICFPGIQSKDDFHDGYALVLKDTNEGNRQVLMNNKGEILDVKIDAMSLYNVGQDQEYEYNRESDKRYLKCALSNYLKSANLGNLSACYKIGYYYFSGIGFQKNYAEAAKWLEKSLPLDNNGENYRYLAYCYSEGGYGIEKNESKAFNLFTEGAKRGNEYCEFALAVCYRKGLGCQADIEKACMYADIVYAKNKSFYASVYSLSYNELAYFYLYRKDYEKSLICIEKAINAQPNVADFYDSKGEILFNMGKVDDALKMWNKVLNLNPSFLNNYPGGTELYKLLKSKGLI